ncbi:MAG: molybdopterin-guanine dinucleotide biosynthesis protein B [Bacteroidetes bacterium]|nr:molybdopterin-guanine dinucleotide biosynthesis protein B [Bacteroidota bacterium]
MLYLPNLLLISGTGRNSGKTSLACAIIQKFAAFRPIIAIKIAPHFHEQDQIENYTYKTAEYFITEETRKDTGKDSSRMLAAGAAKSYYITTHDDHLLNAFENSEAHSLSHIPLFANRAG